MTREKDEKVKRKFFRLGDLLWVICFVGLAILLLFAAVYLWETWQTSTLSRQFLGR